MDGPDSANDKALPPPLDDITAGVEVIRRNCIHDILDRKIITLQLFRRSDNMVLFYQSSEIDHIGYPWNLKKSRDDNPVLQSSQLHRSMTFVRFNDIPEDLADRTGEGTKRWSDPVGKGGIVEFLKDPLPGEVIVRSIFEG